MSSQEKTKKEKYLMDKRIVSILKRAPKRGIWMKELALKLNVSRPLLNYYLFGMQKKRYLSGGRLRTLLIIRKEGNNRFACLLTKEKSSGV